MEVFLCFQILALGSLKEAAMKVYTELSTGSLNGARKNLSHIVGRDTANMNEKDVIKATGGMKKLLNNTNVYSELLKEFLNIYDKTTNREIPIRRIGINFENVTEADNIQLSLFTNE